jgi:hypothetical protein
MVTKKEDGTSFMKGRKACRGFLKYTLTHTQAGFLKNKPVANNLAHFHRGK